MAVQFDQANRFIHEQLDNNKNGIVTISRYELAVNFVPNNDGESSRASVLVKAAECVDVDLADSKRYRSC